MNEILFLKEDVREFLQLIEELIEGKVRLKNKDIAIKIDMAPPRFSNLKNIAREIRDSNKRTFDNETIKEFIVGTNITVKIVEKIGEYNEIMKGLISEKKTNFYEEDKNIKHNFNSKVSLYEKWIEYQKRAIIESYRIFTDRELEWAGLYNVFFHSSTQDILIKKHLLISLNKENETIEVYLGNNLSPYNYKGHLILIGNHTINISLTDNLKYFREIISIQLIQPYRKNAQILRGLVLALTTDYKPSAFRIILKKINSNCTLEEFQQFEELDLPSNKNALKYCESEILSYLLDNMSGTMRCFNVTPQSFDAKDLIKEQKIINQKYPDRFIAYFNSACFLANKNEDSKLQEAFEHLEKALLYGFEDKKQLKKEWETGCLKSLQQIAKIDVENLMVFKLKED